MRPIAKTHLKVAFPLLWKLCLGPLIKLCNSQDQEQENSENMNENEMQPIDIKKLF